MIGSILRRAFSASADSQAHRLYIALVAQARQPFFYETLTVPDTVDGRFDMILLHVFLFTHRLRQEEGRETLASAITDAFFDDMDRNLREMGVGDMSVGKKIKVMAHAFNGRFLAYEQTLNDEPSLAQALMRNVFGAADAPHRHAHALARYCRRAAECLATTDNETLCASPIVWPAVEA